MAEPWPVERFSASCWRVLHDSAHHDSIDFWHEEHARRYAALPVLMDLARMVLASEREGDVYLTQPVVDAARAALKAAGEET